MRRPRRTSRRLRSRSREIKSSFHASPISHQEVQGRCEAARVFVMQALWIPMTITASSGSTSRTLTTSSQAAGKPVVVNGRVNTTYDTRVGIFGLLH
jgi:hypothetical protein